MKQITPLAFIVLIASLAQADTCKYGLGYTYGTDSCSVRETEALQRVAAAKTICSSANSEVLWRKGGKEPTWAWTAISKGSYSAMKGFTSAACEGADLVVKFTYDDVANTVRLTVTDAESGSTVFEETRTVADLGSDVVRMADHWHGMVADARAAAMAAEEVERSRERQAKLDEEFRQCQIEFDSLKQNIIAYVGVQQISLSPTILAQITAHNNKCSNTISPEQVMQQEKADVEAKLTQEKAAREKALQDQRAVTLEKQKADMLVLWQQKIASAPFAPPVDGWMHATPLPNIPSYVILPGKGLTTDCHFSWSNSKYEKPVLDCLGEVGKNPYFAVQSGGRWYLLKSKWTGSGDYAGTVKDKSSTICLRKAGCYHVLAEVRPQPTELPDKLQVPTPGSLTRTYENDELFFNYPQNWQAEERKKDNVIISVNVAAPEAHLGTWVTHGFFVGRVTKMSSNFPQTLDGAYEQCSKSFQNRGFVLTAPKTMPIGDHQGQIAAYSQPSPFTAGERGWLVVVKDRNEGYYWVVLFFPSNEDNSYSQTFEEVLKSFKFKK